MKTIKYFLACFAILTLVLLLISAVVGDELEELFEDVETSEESIPSDEGIAEEVTPPSVVEKAHPKAQISYIEGEVSRKKYKAPEWIRVLKNTEVESQEKVRTMQQSRAEILLDSEKAIRLAPKTTVDLLKLFKEEEKKIATAINVEEGAVWANIAKLEDNVNLSVNSKLTTAAVRGTVFSLQVDQNAATQIKVYRGQVEVYNPYPKATVPGLGTYEMKPPHEVQGPSEVPGPKEVTVEEWTKIILNATQELSIGPGEKAPTVRNFSPTDPSEQNEWVKWNLMRDKLFESIRQKLQEKK